MTLYQEWKVGYFDTFKIDTLEYLQNILTELAAQIPDESPNAEASLKSLKDSYKAMESLIDVMAWHTDRLAGQVIFPPVGRRGRPRKGCKFCN